ncbi:MAG: glycine cleavage system protein GcvH [Fretibacterium sp.]|nr:glycine cleavage system protein GcvH [Fretibacterium sp.]
MRAPFFSSEVLYTKTNEWAMRCGERVRVGIDDYSQSALGDVVAIDLPEVGTGVTAGKPFGSLEATKAVSDLNAPVSGRVIRVNPAVAEAPGLVNDDPFGEGWLIEIEPAEPAKSALQGLDALMDVEAYKLYLKHSTAHAARLAARH